MDSNSNCKYVYDHNLHPFSKLLLIAFISIELYIKINVVVVNEHLNYELKTNNYDEKENLNSTKEIINLNYF